MSSNRTFSYYVIPGFDLNKRPHELSIDRNEVEVIVIEDSESPTTHTLPHRVALQGLINNPGRDMWIYKMILVSRIHKIPLFRFNLCSRCLLYLNTLHAFKLNLYLSSPCMVYYVS